MLRLVNPTPKRGIMEVGRQEMDPRTVTKEDARAILSIAAHKIWAELTEYAWQDNRPLVAARAEQYLEAALRGIEHWLDAVYEFGADPRSADEEFLSDSDRRFGFGFQHPSQVIDRALAKGWVEIV
jgi:hypothetical protein